MPSITSWTRLEPRARSDAMWTSLHARIHDPLWLLARQWQFGEFQGEDTGSLVRVMLEAERSTLTHYLPGRLDVDAPRAGHIYDSGRVPLETQVEREPVRAGRHDRRLASEAGLHFFRLLGPILAQKYRPRYLEVDGYAMPRLNSAERQKLDTHSLRFLDVVAGRVLNGDRLYHDLKAAGPGRLPTEPAIEPGDRQAVFDAAATWLVWYETLFSQPSTTDGAWRPRQMEYEFAVAAPATAGPITPNGEVVLRAPEYMGGHLDWHAFTIAPTASLGAAEPAPRIVEGRQDAVALAIAPEATQALLARRDGRFAYWDLDSGAATDAGAGPESPQAVAFTPAGAYALVTQPDGQLTLWDIENAREQGVLRGTGAPVRAAALCQDGRRALVADAAGTLTIWDVDTADVARTLVGPGGLATAVALTHDGTRTLVGFEDGTVAFWEFDGGDDPRAVVHMEGPTTAVALSPEGERALVALASGTLHLWSPDSVEASRAFWGHATTVVALAFAPDGAAALSLGSDGTGKRWEIEAIEQSTVETVTRAATPAPVSFRGMPAARWWAFEDAQVNFGAVDAAPEDLARLLLLEFMLIYGNDFFIIPVELPVGSLCRTYAVTVTNTFGERLSVPATSAIDALRASGKPWRMFTLSLDSPPADDSLGEDYLFLPPVLGSSLESAPVEDVRFVRDEMANVAWAIERVVQSQAGHPIDRLEAAREEARRDEMADPDSTIPVDGPLAFRLATETPPYWFPLLPKARPTGEQGVRGAIELELRVELGGPRSPQGHILDSGSAINEEEVPRTGIRVTRTYQHARWIDGSTHLWIGRRKRPGRGEASSGLRFDVIEPQAKE